MFSYLDRDVRTAIDEQTPLRRDDAAVPDVSRHRSRTEEDPQAQGHDQCPLGYVNTLGTTCVSPIAYEVQPSEGDACPSG